MRALAAAYAILAALAMPALLWAADEPPPAQTTPAATTTTATTPAPETTVPEPAPAEKVEAAEAEPEVEADVSRRPPVARTAASGGVTIEDFAFSPRTITVDPGDTVTWTNRDGVAHTATADDGSFDTGDIDSDGSASETFDEPGTYPYHCTPHPNMTGTVVVRGASSSTPSADPESSSSGDDDASSPGSSGSSGRSLPATGLQVGIVALGGVLLLSGGALLRRRLER